MQLGALLPLGDIGGDPDIVREYAQAAEVIGYDFIETADHVLGVDAASRPGWDRNPTTICFTIRLSCSVFSPAAQVSSGFPPGS